MKLTNLGRKLEVQLRVWKKPEEGGKKEPVDTVETGIFHQWGSNLVRKKESPILYQTIGIVELEDGQIVRVLPEFITFKEPMKEI